MRINGWECWAAAGTGTCQAGTRRASTGTRRGIGSSICGAIMEYRVLGTVELWHAGRRWDPGPEKIRCLLAVLLLNMNAVVTDDLLIERLWDANPPAKARESLSTY